MFDPRPKASNERVSTELLAEEARACVVDVRRIGDLGIIGEVERKIGVLCDIAAFGDPEDLDIARDSLMEIFRTIRVDQPLEPAQIHSIEKHISLAVELGGGYLTTVKQFIDAIPRRTDRTYREKFMVSLALSGDENIIQQAIKEVMECDFEQERIGWLIQLNEVVEGEISPLIISLTKDMDTNDALDSLMYHSDTVPPAIAEEAARRFGEVELEKFDVTNLGACYAQEKYFSELAVLYRYTGDEKYKQAFAEHIKKMPLSISKLRILAYNADIYDPAPEEIKQVAENAELTEDSITARGLLPRAYAEQKKFEQAVEKAEKIDKESADGLRAYSHAYQMIIIRGGVHLLDKAIEAISESRRVSVNKLGKVVTSIAEYDSDLMDLARKILEFGFYNKVLEIIPHLQDPAHKIHLLRNIAAMSSGKKYSW